MRYVIYGAGGVGSIIGAKLFMAGFDVVLIARGEHLAAIQRDGLQLKHPNPEATECLPITAVAHPNQMEFGPDDVVLLTMKSQDTAPALDELRYAAGDQVVVVSAQNGVENERLALRRFANVYGMLVIMPASFTEPGSVETTAWPVTGVLDLSRYPRGSDATAEAIAADLKKADFLSSPDADVMRVKYAKLRENMINAVHALLPPETDTTDILESLRAETTACFEAAGIESDATAVMMQRAKGMSASVGGVGTGGWRGSSTWQGIMRGTGSSETDYLNGEAVLLGRLYGVATPMNEVMALYVDRMVREKQAPGSVTLEELRDEITKRAALLSGK